MNVIDALPDAMAVWRVPDDMVQMWRESEWKAHHEDLVARWVGKVATVADIGCGSGRYAHVIQYGHGYWGYDASPRMVELAQLALPPKAGVVCVDAMAYESSLEFDAVLCIDVAQHYPDPIGAIKTMLSHWRARRYFVSLVCATKAEALSATTVTPYEDLLALTGGNVRLEHMYWENFDGLAGAAWVLMEMTNGTEG